MSPIIHVNPFSCRMWALHDRLEGHITEESCRTEIDTFERHGQLVPALGRALKNDPEYEVELIYGARRLFVARHLNVPLLVELRTLTDREAVIAMDIENRQRTDISPYERGQSYARCLRVGHFRSQEELARALRVSTSQVSRLIKIAQLPAAIVAAFSSAADICEGWGLELAKALEDPQRRQQTLQVARAIAAREPRPSACEVYRQLVAAFAEGRKVKPARRDDIVKDRAGAPLFRIRQQRSSIAVVVPLSRLSASRLAEMRGAILNVLDRSGTGAAEPGSSSAEPGSPRLW